MARAWRVIAERETTTTRGKIYLDQWIFVIERKFLNIVDKDRARNRMIERITARERIDRRRRKNVSGEVYEQMSLIRKGFAEEKTEKCPSLFSLFNNVLTPSTMESPLLFAYHFREKLVLNPKPIR